MWTGQEKLESKMTDAEVRAREEEWTESIVQSESARGQEPPVEEVLKELLKLFKGGNPKQFEGVASNTIVRTGTQPLVASVAKRMIGALETRRQLRETEIMEDQQLESQRKRLRTGSSLGLGSPMTQQSQGDILSGSPRTPHKSTTDRWKELVASEKAGDCRADCVVKGPGLGRDAQEGKYQWFVLPSPT